MHAVTTINPEKELKRLSALKNFNVLDTLPEKSFDEITRLASIICDAPVSYISFIDSERQWFKSKQGFHLKETPRQISFCNHTIQEPSGKMIIEDARLDARFEKNPMVQPNIGFVFYAGVSILDEKNNALGTLCVIDNKARSLNDEQLTTLEVLGSQVLQLLKLHQNNQELSSSLEESKERIKSLERFAYVAAHDIKSPLANISTLLELLDQETRSKLNNHEQEILHHVKTSALSLNNFIKGLLDYNRSEILVTEQREQVSIDMMIRNLRLDYQGKRQVKFNINIETEHVFVIRIALEQVLRNVIDNAIKYCDKDLCEITFSSWQEENRTWIRVKDNGPGFPEKNRDALFDLFVVGAQCPGEEIKGSGIGLATVKRLVSRLGGQIRVSNAEEGGCMFDFSFISK